VKQGLCPISADLRITSALPVNRQERRIHTEMGSMSELAASVTPAMLYFKLL